MIAVGVCSCCVLVMAHLSTFLARVFGMWCRMWNPVHAAENQVPEEAGCGAWCGGVRKLVHPGVMLSSVAVVSVQSLCLASRAFIIQVGKWAGLCPSDLLLNTWRPCAVREGMSWFGSVCG